RSEARAGPVTRVRSDVEVSGEGPSLGPQGRAALPEGGLPVLDATGAGAGLGTVASLLVAVATDVLSDHQTVGIGSVRGFAQLEGGLVADLSVLHLTHVAGGDDPSVATLATMPCSHGRTSGAGARPSVP